MRGRCYPSGHGSFFLNLKGAAVEPQGRDFNKS